MSRPYFLRISQDIIDNNREFIQSKDLKFYKGNYIWPELLDTINIDGQDTNSNALVESTVWPRIREDNPNGIIFEELEAAQVARVREEVAFVVLNGNYALEAGLSVGKDSIAFEASDSTAAQTYVNIIAVKEGNENNEAVKALVDVLKSDEIKKYINDTYDGAVIPFE